MQTLSIKLTVPIVVVFIIVGFAVYFSVSSLVRQSLYQDIFNRHRIAVQKIPRAEIEQAFQDPSSPQSQLEFERFYAIVRDPTIGRFTIWDPKGNIVFSDFKALIGESDPQYQEVQDVSVTNRPEFGLKTRDTGHIIQANFGEFLDIFIPLQNAKGDAVGVLEIHGSLQAVISPLQSALRNIYLLLVGSLLVVFLVIVVIVRYLILQPLDVLGKTAENVSSGVYKKEDRTWSNDEVGRVGRAFDLMLEALEERQKKLKQANNSLTKSTDTLNKKNDELEQMNKFMVGR